MRIVAPDRLLKMDKYYMKPFTRYVVSDYELDLMLGGAPRTTFNWSCFNAHERRYGGQDLSGKKVCLYRHNAWGDQLIASSVPRYLKERYPDCVIHMYCHPDVMALWDSNPYVDGSAIPLPIPFESMKKYDYHIFYEGMLEGNSEHDQQCCYDDFFETMGMMDVPDEYKIPFITPRPEDYSFYRKAVSKEMHPYLLYHMSPANKNRSYPSKLSCAFMSRFLAAHPEYHVIIVGQDEDDMYGEDLSKLGQCSRIVNLLDKSSSFRDLVGVVANAEVVVCPDSAILHLAAVFPNVPVVSLWGLFDPNDRAQYYKNNHPISAFSMCPHAPCRDHGFFLPLESCKDSRADKNKTKIKHCAALEGITPNGILSEVERHLR